MIQSLTEILSEIFAVKNTFSVCDGYASQNYSFVEGTGVIIYQVQLRCGTRPEVKDAL